MLLEPIAVGNLKRCFAESSFHFIRLSEAIAEACDAQLEVDKAVVTLRAPGLTKIRLVRPQLQLPLVLTAGRFPGCNRLGKADHAFGLHEVKQLGHPAVHLQHPLAGIDRIGEGGDYIARLFHRIGGRGEDGVARLDLARMDQRLAIEAEGF